MFQLRVEERHTIFPKEQRRNIMSIVVVKLFVIITGLKYFFWPKSTIQFNLIGIGVSLMSH